MKYSLLGHSCGGVCLDTYDGCTPEENRCPDPRRRPAPRRRFGQPDAQFVGAHPAGGVGKTTKVLRLDDAGLVGHQHQPCG